MFTLSLCRKKLSIKKKISKKKRERKRERERELAIMSIQRHLYKYNSDYVTRIN